jgi:hypothetical protein
MHFCVIPMVINQCETTEAGYRPQRKRFRQSVREAIGDALRERSGDYFHGT